MATNLRDLLGIVESGAASSGYDSETLLPKYPLEDYNVQYFVPGLCQSQGADDPLSRLILTTTRIILTGLFLLALPRFSSRSGVVVEEEQHLAAVPMVLVVVLEHMHTRCSKDLK